jgi:V/A-type H+-transporting ATPase subunit E
MNSNKENLEGIVSKLKEQGITAGEEEKLRIIDNAKRQAERMLSEAEAEKRKIIEEARTYAEQTEKNARIAITQASRDMVEATKIAILDHLQLIFGNQAECLFSREQYLEELVKVVVESVSGNKTVSVPADKAKEMEAFILKQALNEQVELKPLVDNSLKIVVNSTDNEGVQFVLSNQDVEDGLFSLLNKDLVKRITLGKEA